MIGSSALLKYFRQSAINLFLIPMSIDTSQQLYNLPIIISTHPRLKKNIEYLEYKKICDPLLRFEEPFGFKDFINLEHLAKCVITDSGTVMEETTILNVPCVVIRDTTERPECQECGAISVTGCDESTILSCIEFTLSTKRPWNPPQEYMQMNVSDTIVKILLGR